MPAFMCVNSLVTVTSIIISRDGLKMNAFLNAVAFLWYLSFAMTEFSTISRRHMLAAFAASPLAALGKTKHIPVGLEMFSVRGEMHKDLSATLQVIAKQGYECVEFFAPYFEWTTDYAKQIRTQLDGLGMKCYSTHNGLKSYQDDGFDKAMELNGTLGARYIVLASAGDPKTIDGWKQVAETLNKGNEKFAKANFHAGYHNHDVEWRPIDGQRPLEVLAQETDKSVMLQLDVGTCLEAGCDPVAWIEKNPGRIRSLHLKDWGPEKGYKVLFGEGVAPWKKIFAAAETTGGVEYYLIEQEGSQYSEIETADRCLVAFQDLHR
jgi:sugar phosphate isomerase/epimerase